MGHQRLGTLPRSKLWRDVVELIDHSADVDEVAAATSLAAEQGMIDASQDAAVQHAFFLMAMIPLAAREDDFEAALRGLGMPIKNGPMLADIVCGLMEATDTRTKLIGSRSDYGEIAQLSAAEALYAVIGRQTRDLFGVDALATKSAVAGFATVRQFAVLARDFFARLTRRHINYYLSRELSKHVGPSQRFVGVREHRLPTRRRKLDAGDLAAEILRRCEQAGVSAGYVVCISDPITARERLQPAAARIQR